MDGRENKSTDVAVQQMLGKAEREGVETVWDRYKGMQPQCKFGDTGLCCRHCLQGPCRINLRGGKPQLGICAVPHPMLLSPEGWRALSPPVQQDTQDTPSTWPTP